MSWRAQISKNLSELRIVFDPKAAGSAGTQLFVKNNYKELKRLNPKFPFLVRPHEEVKSKFVAIYDFGETVEKDLDNLGEDDILTTLRELVIMGEHNVKANLLPYQSRYKSDVDCVKFEDLKEQPYQYRHI